MIRRIRSNRLLRKRINEIVMRRWREEMYRYEREPIKVNGKSVGAVLKY